MDSKFSKQSVSEAHLRIADKIHRTPILTNRWIDQELKLKLHFKCENFQKGGAFKIRGATNAVLSLDEGQAKNGVVTHSSGNHAQAVAIAAASRSVSATVVMPENSPSVKIEATRGYGADVVLCQPTQKSRLETCDRVAKETGATLIHPFDNQNVILGQASVCKEILEDVPESEVVIGPVGGGGLMAGTCLSATHFGSTDLKVFAAEPEGADDTYQSFQVGERKGNERVDTIADGLLTDVGELTWPIIYDRAEQVLVVEDEWVRKAQRFYWQRMKLVVEPSGAVSLAALWKAIESGSLSLPASTKVSLIITGGNCDFPF